LKGRGRGRWDRLRLLAQAMLASPRSQDRPLLARMGLAQPATAAERLLARLVSLGLKMGSAD
jgi:hypothetical protein